jgi:site-specific recombinase XerD
VKRTSQPWISPAAEQLLDNYRGALHQRGELSAVTIRNYLSDLRQFIAWSEETPREEPLTPPQFRLSDLTTPLIARYRAFLLAVLTLKPASVNRMLISIKRFCAWATARGMLASDPSLAIRLTTGQERGPRILTDEEEHALLATVARSPHLRDRAIVITLLRTGVRAPELCALRSDHLHLDARGGLLVVAASRAATREVPLDADADQALRLYLPTRPPTAIPLFVADHSVHPLTERTVGRIVHKYAEEALMPDVSPQSLRNRFGYRMARSLPLPEVARLMGHTSLATAVRYLQPVDDR